jgi:bifunctional non-homologous end joining protein LigD
MMAGLEVEGELVRCGWAGSGLTTKAGRDVRAALDAKRPIVVASRGRCRRPA